MIDYGIEIFPHIKKCKWEEPDLTQPKYTDNVGSMGMFVRIETYFDSLTHKGTRRGYQPKPSKIFLLVHPENLEAGKTFCARFRFKLCIGARYLRVYIRDKNPKRDLLRDHMMM